MVVIIGITMTAYNSGPSSEYADSLPYISVYLHIQYIYI